jgi:hypothetical protein
MTTDEKLKVINSWCEFTIEKSSVDEYYARVRFPITIFVRGIYSFHTVAFPLRSELIDNAYLVIRERIWYSIRADEWIMEWSL